MPDDIAEIDIGIVGITAGIVVRRKTQFLGFSLKLSDSQTDIVAEFDFDADIVGSAGPVEMTKVIGVDLVTPV